MEVRPGKYFNDLKTTFADHPWGCMYRSAVVLVFAALALHTVWSFKARREIAEKNALEHVRHRAKRLATEEENHKGR
jgi:hypothetical protein